MKSLLVIFLLCLSGANLLAQSNIDEQLSLPTGQTSGTNLPDGPYVAIERDANTCVWQRETYEQGPDGEIITNYHSYTEIASGLNHLINGEWIESTEEIDVLPDGTAAATNGQHQAYFPADIYSGTIELVTPDGKQLVSRPVGLSYFDGTNSVLVAELTNSVGSVIGNNRVIYTNAFSGLKADLLYEYTKAGFEQDIIVREQPPTPESFGLDPNSTRLQVLTEFFNPPQPSVAVGPPTEQAGVALSDETLDFGATQMIRGRACLFGTNANDGGAWVAKSWEMVEGRQILIEEVPVNAVINELLQLPAATTTSVKSSPSSPLIVSARHLLPAQRVARRSIHKVKLARTGFQNGPGLVLDYQIINTGLSNYTFQGDTTYLVGAVVNLTGTTAIEGGAVIKYTNSSSAPGQLNIMGTLTNETAPYRPAIFTVMDDNSVGEQIAGARGGLDVPPPGDALKFSGSGSQIVANMRFIDMNTAIDFNNGTGSQLTLRDVQFVDSSTAILTEPFGTQVNGENVLMMQVTTGFSSMFPGTVTLENMTANGVSYLGSTNGWSLNVTNSILAGTGTTGLSMAGAYNAFFGSTSFGVSSINLTNNPFQTNGAGECYININSQAHGWATTNIDPVLLADLSQKTTYAPVLCSNQTISIATNFTPQVQRDTNASDLGYHYDPIDYIADTLTITNASITLSGGVVVANYNRVGITLQNGSSMVSTGTPLVPNLFVRYQSVQEEPTTLGGSNPSASLSLSPNHFGNTGPTGTFTFTRFASPAAGGYSIYTRVQTNYSSLTIRNCEFWGGQDEFTGSSNTTCTVVNNLFFRSAISAGHKFVPPLGPMVLTNDTLAFTNNLAWGSSIDLTQPTNSAWFAFNNDFDSASFPSAGNLTNGWNGYLNCSGRLQPTNANDVVTNVTMAYQAGPLGNYYQPPGGILVDKGNMSATNIGLYHFTTQTNQAPETNSTVDIGYHYVALDTNGNPLDFTGDGVPDYRADSNGDGIYDAGDPADWLLGIDSQPQSQNVVQGTNVTFSVVAGGLTPISYQWMFNSNNISGATNSDLILLVVTNANEGSYSVVAVNSSGSVTSSVAVLTVFDPLEITSGPNSSTVVQGGTTNFSVTISGNHPVYQWFTNGGAVSNPRISGATTADMTISGALGSDTGNYYVVATNLFNCVTSSLATLTVITNPAVVTPPGNFTNIQADDVTFSVKANGAALSYQWWAAIGFDTNSIPGATNWSYTKLVVQTNDEGEYSVVITNLAGSTNASGSLKVLVPPWITIQPVSVTNNVGSSNGFFATAFGTTNLGYQWYKDGTNAILNATTAALSITNIQTNDAGGYFLVVSNIAGTNRSAWAWLSVVSGGTTYPGWGGGSLPVSSNAVWMISPTNLYSANPAIYPDGTSISIRASATSQMDYITNLAFYSSTNTAASTNFALFTNLPGSSTRGTNITFGYAWTNASHGTNLLLAVANDDKGLSVTSAVVYVIMDDPPDVSAGAGQTLTWPTNTFSTNLVLAGAVTDDGLPYGITNVLWSVISSNGTVTISNALATNTIATFANYGTYVLQLKGDDGFTNSTSTCTITLNEPPFVSFVSPPTNNYILLSNAPIVLTANAYGPSAAIASVTFYDGTNSLGAGVPTLGNNYNLAWSSDLVGNHQLSAVASNYVGLCSTSTVTIAVVPPLAATITSPTNTQLFVITPTNILLTAQVTNFACFPVTNVSFSNQFVNLGAATNVGGYAWQLLWGATNGTYTNTVVARDSGGDVAIDSIIITNNAMPTVSITNLPNPPNLVSFLEVTNVTIKGVASDSDGRVTNVAFWDATNGFIGSTTNVPFTFVWSNRVAGYYPIVAVATDNDGASSVSQICVFKVIPTNSPPTVWITYPTNGAVFPPGSEITITATATNYPASITNVEFFVNGQSIGSDPAAPYEITECCWKPGTYVLQATAFDSTGAWNISTNVTITIAPYAPVGQGFWDPVFGQFATAALGFCSLAPDTITFGPDGTVYIGPRNYDSCLDPSAYFATEGTNWVEMSGVGGAWSGLLADGTNVYGGGDLTVGGKGQVEVWNGTQWSTLGNDLDVGNWVKFAIVGGHLYAAGDFEYGGDGSLEYPIDTNVQLIAKLDTVSNRWVPVGNGITNGEIYAIAAVGNTIYVGGSFTNAGGDPNANYIACLENASWTNLGPGLSLTIPDVSGSGPSVTALAACGNQLFVGGDFDTAGGNANANGIAVWNGEQWQTIGNGVGLNPGLLYSGETNHSVWAIAARGNQIFVGGEFTNALDDGGVQVAANNIAMATWSEANQTWSWSDLDQGIDGQYLSVSALAIEEGSTPNSFDLYVAGGFTSVGSCQIPSANVARWRVGYPAPPSVPRVSITSPSSPTILTNPPSIILMGLAQSSYSNIDTANFYTDGAAVGIQSSYPAPDSTNFFEFTNEWASPSPGLYLISAVATGQTGLIGQSPPLVINIKSTTNPVVAVDDQFTIQQGTLAITLPVLTNDSPSSGLHISQVTMLHNNLGTASIGHNGTYLNYSPLPNVYGTDLFYYTVTDANGNSDSASVTVRILPLPIVTITSPPDSSRYVVSSPPIAITNRTVDYDSSITNVTLYTNGTVYSVMTSSVSGSFITNWTANTAGFYTFVAVATDSNGVSGTSAPVTLVLTNTSPSSGYPIATISNLVDTTNLNYGVEAVNLAIISNGFFELFGQASDTDGSVPVAYNVTLYRPQDYDYSLSDDPEVLIDVTTPYADVTPGEKNAQGYHIGGDVGGDLGRLDLTTIPNGTYDLVLRVRGGTDETNSIVRVELQSNLKIGQFSFSEQDLTLPVNGIPLTVTRTYNSLNPDSGAFGTSWSYALSDMNVQLDDAREDITIGNDNAPFDDQGLPKTVNMRTGGGWDVTLTLPNGQRTTFQFSYTGNFPTYQAQWNAPGVNATLEPINTNDANIVVGYDGLSTPVWETSTTGLDSIAPFENQDFSGWILTTTTDGVKYYITRGTTNHIVIMDPAGSGQYISARVLGPPKLTKIQSVSGDSIVISDNGIFHYDQVNNLTRSILFDRDSQDRIIALHDPNGGSNGLPAVKYLYDNDNNNLVQVLKLVDRNNGIYTTNKYDYNNPNFPHYITSIENGDGIPVARNYYDDSGRLTSVQDANGTTTYFNHSTTNNTDIVVDRLLHTNSYVYDLQGNVIWQTNALGQVTASTYGDPNNPTLETAVTNAYGTTVATWTLYAYDQNGNQTNVVSMGHTNSSAYDGSGNMLSHIDPLGNVTSNIYDDFGDLTNTIQYDAKLNIVSQSSSVYVNGYLTQTLNANQQVTATFSYDDNGNLTNTTDANGLTRTFSYDENGNQTNSSYQWTPPGGGSSTNVTTSTSYDAQNRVTQSLDALGNTNSTFYDSAGRVAYTIDKFGNTNSMLYDALGNLIQTTYPNNTVTRTVYDAAGRAYLTTDRNGTSGTMTSYDAQGRATNVIRLTNVVVNINYNGSVAESVAITTNGPISTNSTVYDAAGRVISRTSPDGTTSYDYYADGQVMRITDPLTNIIFYAYDAADRQTNTLDALNHSTTFQYDAVGRTIATVYNDNSAITNVFDNLGNRVQTVDQAKLVTQFGYNVAGQLTSVVKPTVPNPETGGSNSPTWSYIYDTYSHPVATFDPKQRATTNVFDAFNRQFSQRLPLGQTNYSTYNSLGQVVTNFDFKGQWTKFAYDQFGRVAAKFFFTSAGYLSNSVCYQYDQLDRITSVTERYGGDAATNSCDGYQAFFGPDLGPRIPPTPLLAKLAKPSAPLIALLAFCAVLTLVPGGRNLRRMLVEYYFRGGWRVLPASCQRERKISPYRLAKWMPSYFWRAASVLMAFVLVVDDPAWDRAFAQCSPPESSNIANSTPTTRITSYTYDFDGHMTQMNSPEGYINYGYDPATGRLISTCTTNSYIGYGYDALGRLQTVHVTERNGASVNEWTTNHYDPVGNRSEMDLPNGVVTKYYYDTLNRLTNMTHHSGTTNLAGYTYTLNASGRRTNAVEILRIPDDEGGGYMTNALSWQFDGMYRLTNEISVFASTGSPYAFTNAYQYDLAGNRLLSTRTGGGAQTISCTYDANDELLGETNGTVITTHGYDANGSMTSSVTGTTNWAYGYDIRNKLSSVAYNNTVQSIYQYNDQGIRVRSIGASTKYYLIDANNCTGYQQTLEEFSTLGGTPTMSYVMGDDVLGQGGGGSTSYLLADGHGNTRQLWSNTGGVSDRFNYDAYGVIQTATSSMSAEDAVDGNIASHLYCGEQYDSTLQMYNLRARYYNPSNGRFNQRDTFVGNNDDPQSLHKYLYVGCDPITNVDSSGEGVLTDIMIAIYVFAATVAFYVAPVLTALRVAVAVIAIAAFITDADFRGEMIFGSGGPNETTDLIAAEIRFTKTAVAEVDAAVTAPKTINEINIEYNGGDPKAWWRKMDRLTKAAQDGDLAVVEGTDAIRDLNATRRYKRAVFKRFVRYLEQHGMKADDAEAFARRQFDSLDVDHKIDLQVSGLLQDPNAVQNLGMLNSTVNRSIGSQLDKEIQRLQLATGDSIDKINLVNPPPRP